MFKILPLYPRYHPESPDVHNNNSRDTEIGGKNIFQFMKYLASRNITPEGLEACSDS